MRVLRSSRDSGNGILLYQNSQSEDGILPNPTDGDPPPKTARSADNGILSYQHSQSEDDILSNPTDGDEPDLAGEHLTKTAHISADRFGRHTPENRGT